MGLFDEYRTEKPIKCPECQDLISMFQSKVGDCLLITYFGQKPNPDLEPFRFIDAYNICKNSHFVYVRLSINEDGSFEASDKIWVEDRLSSKTS